MTRRRIRQLVGFFILSLAVAVGANVALQGLDNHVKNSNGPNGYRGLISHNFNTADTADEIIGDFGSIGVWAYHGGTWTQLTTLNPDWIIGVKFAAADYEMIGDFGSAGLWMWNYSGWPGVWVQLTASNAENAIAVDDDGDGNDELQVDFGSLGLWRYDYDTGVWTRYTALNPAGTGLRVDLWTVGWEEGLWKFSGSGVWNVYWGGTAPIWAQLTVSAATEDWASGNFVDPGGTSAEPADEVAIEFGSDTWVYDDDGATWTRITFNSTSAMMAAKFGNNDDTELVFADTVYDPWFWGPTWTRLSETSMDDGFATAFDDDGEVETTFVEDEVAADFGTLGLWRYNYTVAGTVAAGWTQLTVSDPVFMIRSDYWGQGEDTSLVVSFGAGVGVWLFDTYGGTVAGHWHHLTNSAPDHTMSWLN